MLRNRVGCGELTLIQLISHLDQIWVYHLAAVQDLYTIQPYRGIETNAVAVRGGGNTIRRTVCHRQIANAPLGRAPNTLVFHAIATKRGIGVETVTHMGHAVHQGVVEAGQPSFKFGSLRTTAYLFNVALLDVENNRIAQKAVGGAERTIKN